MRVVRTVDIVATGVLTVSVSITPRGYTGSPVTLSASWDTIAVGPFHVVIDWGDGTSETLDRVTAKSVSRSHTYTAAGSYTARVTVSDEYTAAEGSGSASTTIAPPLDASITASPTSGTIPLAVTFTCSARDGFAPYTWTLDFGDGSTPASGTQTAAGSWTVTHTYTKIGRFTATLTVDDALGATAVGTVQVAGGVELYGMAGLAVALASLAVLGIASARKR